MVESLSNLNPEVALVPFKTALGKSYDKVVNDVKSMLGRIEDKDVTLKAGGWKATAAYKLKSSEGRTIQLAPNNPATILLCFGMRINELADNGDMTLEASIPKQCEAWVHQHSILADINKVPAKA